jgi:taurine--2-oxoglutarate transaminase
LETGLTYSGHPLACAAGVAAIRAYEDGKLVERSKQLGSWMLERLREMQGRHEAIADVRGLGLFAVLEMNDAGRGVPVPPFPGPLPWLRQLARAALDRGVSIAVRGNLVIVCPPLVIDQEEIGTGLSVMESLL